MALTALYNTGFEHGRLALEGGAPFSLIGGDSTTRDVVTTPVRNGTYSLKCAPSDALQGRVQTPAWTAKAKVQVRFAVRVDAAPAVGTIGRLVYVIIAAGGDPKIEINDTSFICSIIDSGRVTGAAFTIGQWHLIEMQIDAAATNVTTIDWWVDGVAQMSVSRAQTDSTLSKLQLGSPSGTGPAYTAYFDDIAVSEWSATSDRIGDGKGIALSPNADIGAGGGSAASFTVSGAATFWEATDDVPLSSTADYVAQTGGTNADWYKIGTGNTTETAFSGVQALMQYNSSGTAANSAATYVGHPTIGAIQTLIYSGDMSESSSSLFYKTVQVAPRAWTQAEVNDLEFWFGFGSDINPNPRWHAFILELDVPAAAGPVAKSASDSLVVGVTDALVAQIIRSTVTDTLTLGTAEALAGQVIRSSATDALTLSIAETAAVAIRAFLSASDTLALGVTDALSKQVIRSSSTDALTVAITDTGSVVVVGGGVVAVTASDTLALSIADAVGGQVARSTAADTLAVGITDALSKQLARTTATDSLTLGLVEALAAQRIRSTATDILGLAVTDAVALKAFVAAVDILGLAVTEVGSIRIPEAGTDLRIVIVTTEPARAATSTEPSGAVSTEASPAVVSSEPSGSI